jgi:hypothetical protein
VDSGKRIRQPCALQTRRSGWLGRTAGWVDLSRLTNIDRMTALWRRGAKGISAETAIIDWVVRSVGATVAECYKLRLRCLRDRG